MRTTLLALLFVASPVAIWPGATAFAADTGKPAQAGMSAQDATVGTPMPPASTAATPVPMDPARTSTSPDHAATPSTQTPADSRSTPNR